MRSNGSPSPILFDQTMCNHFFWGGGWSSYVLVTSLHKLSSYINPFGTKIQWLVTIDDPVLKISTSSQDICIINNKQICIETLPRILLFNSYCFIFWYWWRTPSNSSPNIVVWGGVNGEKPNGPIVDLLVVGVLYYYLFYKD